MAAAKPAARGRTGAKSKPAARRRAGGASEPPAAPAPRTPLLEWIAAAVGALLTLTVLGVIGFDIVAGRDRPPAFEIRALGSSPVAGGFLLQIQVENLGDRAAAQVEVEGTLRRGDQAETARATFDDVPAGSSRTGGLFFGADPQGAAIDLKASGFADP